MEYQYTYTNIIRRMKRAQSIKDKQKLFRKLFISPSYCQPLDPPLLVSPDFINLLLEESSMSSREYQFQIMNEILNIFIQRPTNSLLLNYHDHSKLQLQKSILDCIILRILSIIKTQDQVEIYLEKVVLMISYYKITLRNISKLTQYLSKMAFLQKFDPVKLMFIIRLLKLYYSPKLGQIKSPMHYFYLYGQQNSGIQSIQLGINETSYKNELSVVMSFNSQGESSKPYNLFLVKNDKNDEYGLTYCEGFLKLTCLGNSEHIDQFIVKRQFLDQVWYRLIINFSLSETEVIIDGQILKYKPILRKDKQRKITSFTVGREFFGMIGSVLLSNKCVSTDKFDTNSFPYGIDSISHLKALNKTTIPANVISSCIPFFVFQVRDTFHCFDIFKRNHSSISQNILAIDSVRDNNLDQLGGWSVLQPLFYLARFYKKSNYRAVLEDLLQILSIIYKNYNAEKIESQLQSINFFEILGLHLSDISCYQSPKSIKLLFSILKRIKKQKLKVIFIRHVLWGLNIDFQSIQSQDFEAQIQQQHQMFDLEKSLNLEKTELYKDEKYQTICFYYKSILSLYESSNLSGFAFKAMGLPEIIYWVVQHLQYNSSISFSCCFDHYLNESLLSSEMITQQLVKLNKSYMKIHYVYIEQILTKNLENLIKSNEDNMIENVKTLLRLFLQKYSACFYLTVLRSIRNQLQIPSISSNFGKKEQFIKVLIDPKLELISFLTFLSEKTINPDIISQIMYLSLVILKHGSISKKEEIFRFIINLFHINRNIDFKNENPFKNLIWRLRKHSADTSSEQYSVIVQQNAKRRRKSISLTKDIHEQKITISQQQLSKIIQKTHQPEKLCSYRPIYNLIINFLEGSISLADPKGQVALFSEQSVLIARQYYKLAHSTLKQNILLYILVNIEKKPELKQVSCLIFFLLECLKDSIYTSQDETKNLLTIFTCIFSQIISNHNNITNFYSSIKFLKVSRQAVSHMFPFVLSKILKLATIDQIQDLLSLALYQTTQNNNAKSQQLGRLVISQFHRSIISNLANSVKQGQSYNFLKVVCQYPDKNISLSLEDPFAEEIEQEKMGNQSKQKQQEDFVKQNPGWQTQNVIKPTLKKKISKNISFQKNQGKQVDRGPEKKESSNKIIKYRRQLTAFEIYLKLFFKLIQEDRKLNLKEKFTKGEQKEKGKQIGQDYKEKVQENRKSGILDDCLYDMKPQPKYKIMRDFIQIFKLFLGKVPEMQDGNFYQINFLVTFTFYKISQFNSKIQNQQCLINHKQIIQYFLELSTSIPIQPKNSNSFFLPYLCKYPLTFEKEQIVSWRENRLQIINKFDNKLCQLLSNSPSKLGKFLDQIQDIHDLTIVGFYQRNMQKYVDSYEHLMTCFSTEKSFRNIQKLFDVENSAEEKARIGFLYDNQCNFRKFHFLWNQVWNKLRIYHQPYGFWMAQRTKDSGFTYNSNQIRNFKFSMSQICSSSGIYPILQTKIVEPWTMVKEIQSKKNRNINSFSQMMRPTHFQKEQDEDQKNIWGNLWKGMLKLAKKKNPLKSNQYEVVFICRSMKAIGKLFIQNKQDLIFCYEGVRQEDSHLSFQKFTLAFNQQTYQKWNIFTISKIKVHRYLLRYTALEIFLSEGRSIIFDFLKNDKENFIKQLEKIQKQKLQAHNPKLFKINQVSFFDEGFFDFKLFDHKLTDSWLKREISNLDYLIKINSYASRGIFDLSQYGVVPWITEFKRQKQPKLRDLGKTMGGLGSEERKKIISQKFYANDPFNPYPPFFFGTHYSSPGVVFNILIRLSPFTQYCKHLQGGRFDIPDRLFSSLISAWRSASQQVSDVRELIPEIYYLPQLLINIDQNNFGRTQNDEKINHVEIPPWGANNPYYFVSQLRQIFESEQVSEKINQWIDLIFGYKQKGKQAQASFNVYYYLTYQDYIDIDEDQDEVYKRSREAQIVHFGQIPPMLFEKAHPKRLKAEKDFIYQLKLNKVYTLMNNLKQKPIGIKFINNELCICKRNQFQIYSTLSNPPSLQKRKKINFEKSLTQTYYIIKKQKSEVVFLQKPYLIIWGYLNNQFRVFNRNTGEIDEGSQLPSRITTLVCNKSQNLLLVGLDSGILLIYEIQYGMTDIFIVKVGSEHFPAPISHISQYDGFFSISFGNYCAIYKINRSLHYLTSNESKVFIKFFRSFYNPLPIKASYLATSPLYSIIIIDPANIKSYSINGQFIKSINNNSRFNGIFKDYHLHDVFYAIDEDRIICLSIPDLRNINILELPDYQYIMDLYIVNKNSIQEIGYGIC